MLSGVTWSRNIKPNIGAVRDKNDVAILFNISHSIIPSFTAAKFSLICVTFIK